MNLQLAKRTDIPSMLQIIKKTFSQEDAQYAHKELQEMFSRSLNKPIYIVAVDTKKVIALAGFIPSWFDFNIYKILWVAVDPDFQKKGVGRKIINNIIKRIKCFKGHAKANAILLTTVSPQFFKKCHFKEILPLANKNGVLMMMKL